MPTIYKPKEDLADLCKLRIDVPRDIVWTEAVSCSPVRPLTVYDMIDQEEWLRMCHDLMALIKEHIDCDDLDITDEDFLRIIRC